MSRERRRLGRSGLLCDMRGVGWAEVGCCERCRLGRNGLLCDVRGVG